VVRIPGGAAGGATRLLLDAGKVEAMNTFSRTTTALFAAKIPALASPGAARRQSLRRI
jgi:hypothetical protein